MDMRSDGKPSFCHNATVVSSVSSDNESKPSVMGIGGSSERKNGSHNLLIKSKRNCFVKQPMYDMNAVIKRISPGSVVPWAMNLLSGNI